MIIKISKKLFIVVSIIKCFIHIISGDEMKKKKINDGLRNLPKNFVTENELEENIKTEIAKEITNTRKR